jgi:hypothetical protein
MVTMLKLVQMWFVILVAIKCHHWNSIPTSSVLVGIKLWNSQLWLVIMSVTQIIKVFILMLNQMLNWIWNFFIYHDPSSKSFKILNLVTQLVSLKYYSHPKLVYTVWYMVHIGSPRFPTKKRPNQMLHNS